MLEFEEGVGFFKAKTTIHRFQRWSMSVSNDRNPRYQLLRDWLNIYTWKEVWIVFSVAFMVWGLWWYLCLTFMVPSLLGAVMFWSVFLALVTGAVAVNPEGRC